MSVSFQPVVHAAVTAPIPATGIDWLDQARRDNLNAFSQAGLPNTRVEEWKYTPLRALAQRPWVPLRADAVPPVINQSAIPISGLDGPTLVFVNGCFRADLSRFSPLPEGLSLQPLSEVLVSAPESLRLVLSRRYHSPRDAFACLNAAQASDGVVLRVAPGARIKVPVQMIFMGAATSDDLVWHLRNLVELKAAASLTLIERHIGQGVRPQLGTLTTDLIVHEDADLKHVLVQDAAAQTHLIVRHQVSLHARAHACLHALELGGALVRHDCQVHLQGEGAHLETRGLFVPVQRQHIDTQLVIHHQAVDTSSSSMWRGVADQRGRGVFRGAILVDQGADRTDARLSNKNLLLSQGAEIDTKPELQIHADAVQVAHGATVGQLDQQALFYLRSRGLPHAQARSVLTTAFCQAVLDKLPKNQLGDYLNALLARRLPL